MLRIRFQLPKVLWLGDVRTRSDFMGALVPVVGVIDRAIQFNFDEEGRPKPWKPLSPRYAREKERWYPYQGILERTGRLRRSIKVGVDPRRLSGLADIVATTDVPYAPFHQFGVPNSYLPRRPFLVLTDWDIREAGDALAHALENLN